MIKRTSVISVVKFCQTKGEKNEENTKNYTYLQSYCDN